MTYANPEHPVLRTPRRRPTPWPRDTRNVLTRLAADSVRERPLVSGDQLRWNPSTPVRANAEGTPAPHLRSPANGRVFRSERCGFSPNPQAYPAARLRGVGTAAVSPSIQLPPEYGGIRTLEKWRPSQPRPQPANGSESKCPDRVHRPPRLRLDDRATEAPPHSTRGITHAAFGSPDLLRQLPRPRPPR